MRSSESARPKMDLRRQVLMWVCVFGPALVALIPMAAAPALPAMAREFAVGGDGQLFAQMIMTVPAVMLILFSPLAGLITEKVGARSCMLVCLAVYTLSGAGVLLAESATVLVILRLLLGIAGGGILATSLTLIGNQFSGNTRETLLGYATAMSSVFATAALVFGGVLVDRWGWRAPFCLYISGLLMLIAAWYSIAPGLTEKERVPRQANSDHKALLPTWPYYALLIVLTAGMFTPAIQGPFALEVRQIDNATMRGVIIGATSFVAIFSAGFYGRLRERLSAARVLVIDALAMGIGLTVLGLADGVAGMLLGCALVGVGAGMSEPAIASIILQRTPVYVHGLAMGLVVSALNSGQFVNPLIMSALRSVAGLDMSFVLLGGFLTALGLWVYIRHRKVAPIITDSGVAGSDPDAEGL